MLHIHPVRSPKPIHLVLFTIVALGIGCGGVAQENPYAEPAEPGLPASNMELDFPRVALVVTDPQIDFLSEDGATWGIVGNSVTENGTVENIDDCSKRPRKLVFQS